MDGGNPVTAAQRKGVVPTFRIVLQCPRQPQRLCGCTSFRGLRMNMLKLWVAGR